MVRVCPAGRTRHRGSMQMPLCTVRGVMIALYAGPDILYQGLTSISLACHGSLGRLRQADVSDAHDISQQRFVPSARDVWYSRTCSSQLQHMWRLSGGVVTARRAF